MLPICLRFLYALHMHVILNSFFGRHKMLNHYFCLYDAMNSLNLKDASLNYCFQNCRLCQNLSALLRSFKSCLAWDLKVLRFWNAHWPALFTFSVATVKHFVKPQNTRILEMYAPVHPKRLRLRSHEAGRQTKTRFSNLVCNSTWNTSILPSLGQTNKTNSRPPKRKIWKQRSAKYFLSSHLGNKRPRNTNLPPTTFSICDLTKLPPFPSLSSLMVWILDLRGRGTETHFALFSVASKGCHASFGQWKCKCTFEGGERGGGGREVGVSG